MAALLRGGDRVCGEGGREYRVLEWRAEGSYARIYRAQAPPGGVCAIKLAKAEVPGSGERLEQERAVRARVRHPALVEQLDAGRWEETPFLVLAWIDGLDLRRLVERRRRLPLVTALGYLQDVSAAVAALHAAGYAHGDLRPENVLVEDATQRAILTDLGEVTACTERALLQGDVCGLGGLLTFMLTGERPEFSAPRFTTANGHNPQAVRLWQDACAGRLTASSLHKETTALLKAIGAPRR